MPETSITAVTTRPFKTWIA